MGTKTPTAVSIRDMTVGDLGEVLMIEKSSFSKPWTESLFFGEIRNEKSFARVAEFQGRVIGYVCGSYVLDEGHILTLAVESSQRSRGVAGALVADLIAAMKAKGCSTLFLEVRASNAAASRMYEKFGFRPIGTRKSYYISPQEDAVVMMLQMKGDQS